MKVKSNIFVKCCIVFILALLALSAPSRASWPEQAKLIASDAAENDEFGKSVSISGDWAIVGAPLYDDGDSVNSGSAYIFKRDPDSGIWTEEIKLISSDTAAGDRFGFSVSISGVTAIVGAHYDGSNSGSAYIFQLNGGNWVEQGKLTASDAANADGLAVRSHAEGTAGISGPRGAAARIVHEVSYIAWPEVRRRQGETRIRRVQERGHSIPQGHRSTRA